MSLLTMPKTLAALRVASGTHCSQPKRRARAGTCRHPPSIRWRELKRLDYVRASVFPSSPSSDTHASATFLGPLQAPSLSLGLHTINRQYTMVLVHYGVAIVVKRLSQHGLEVVRLRNGSPRPAEKFQAICSRYINFYP